MPHTDRSRGSEIDPSGVVQVVAPGVDGEERHIALPTWLRTLLFAVVGLFCFILALQLLKQGARVYGGEIVKFLRITNVANSLGFGWLLAYIFLSGSPVAAIAVSFFAGGTISGLQAFTMITGSRLGASFIVPFVGLF